MGKYRQKPLENLEVGHLDHALEVFPNGHRKVEKLKKLRVHLMSSEPSPAKLEKLEQEENVFLLDAYFTEHGGEG